MFKRMILGLLLAFCCSLAQAQAPVQQTATRLDAPTLVQTLAAAGTITITPPAGQYVYLTALDITNCVGGTAVTAATPTSVTTTNFGGATWMLGSGSTVGLCQPSPTMGNFANPLKSAASGTATTIVIPALVTNQNVRVSAYYYFAP